VVILGLERLVRASATLIALVVQAKLRALAPFRQSHQRRGRGCCGASTLAVSSLASCCLKSCEFSSGSFRLRWILRWVEGNSSQGMSALCDCRGGLFWGEGGGPLMMVNRSTRWHLPP